MKSQVAPVVDKEVARTAFLPHIYNYLAGKSAQPIAQNNGRLKAPGLDHLRSGERDHDPSLSIEAATGGWTDHRTDETGDLFALVQRLENLSDFPSALRFVADYTGTQPMPRPRPVPKSESKMPVNPEVGQRWPGLPEPISDAWDYHDEDGRVLYRECRIPTPEKGEGKKTFRQCRPDPESPTGWYAGIEGVRRVLFNLPAVLDAVANGWTIYGCEGPKDALAVAEADPDRDDYVATTNPMGAGKWDPSYTDTLTGAAEIVLVMDDDDEGRKHVRKVADALHGKVGELKIVKPLAGKDAHDHLVEHGHRLEDFVPVEMPEPAEVPEPPATYRRTDTGNAGRFAAQHKDNARYVWESPYQCWVAWDGTRWAPEGDCRVQQLAKQTARTMWNEINNTQDTTERAEIARHAKSSENATRIRNMIDLARSEPEIVLSGDELDTDRHLLNVANGTIDLETGKLRDHRREDLITRAINIAYDPKALAPRWYKFLEEIFDANHELIRYVQTAIGYSLTGYTREQIFFLLHGIGKNGKSTLLETIRATVGDYGSTAAFHTFLLKRNRGDARPDLVRLMKKRYVIAIEADASRRLDESVVKQITGGDTIAARTLYKTEFEFVPDLKLFLACNHRPEIHGQDVAMWRRVRLIPFLVQITPEKRDPKLQEYLKANELPGVLAWAVHGAMEYMRNGMPVCDAVDEFTREYRDDQDILRDFLDEHVEPMPGHAQLKLPVYKAYRRGCESAEIKPLSDKAFTSRMRDHGYKDKKTKRGRAWLNISLKIEG